MLERATLGSCRDTRQRFVVLQSAWPLSLLAASHAVLLPGGRHAARQGTCLGPRFPPARTSSLDQRGPGSSSQLSAWRTGSCGESLHGIDCPCRLDAWQRTPTSSCSCITACSAADGMITRRICTTAGPAGFRLALDPRRSAPPMHGHPNHYCVARPPPDALRWFVSLLRLTLSTSIRVDPCLTVQGWGLQAFYLSVLAASL